MAFSIVQPVIFEEDIKKSRFQGLAFAVASEEAVKATLAAHTDLSTTHQCWAWKIGQQLRFNDDGEPSGTAGRPILAVIEGQDLDQILVLVNRWYGGIKLGAGGLVRAYGGCASKTLALAEKVEILDKKAAYFYCGFTIWASVQHYLNQQQIDFKVDYLTDGVQVTLALLPEQIATFTTFLQNISHGQSQLLLSDDKA